MKNTIKIGFLLTLFSLLLWSCEKEESFETLSQEVQVPNYSVESITFDEFSREIGSTTLSNALIPLFNRKISDGTTSKVTAFTLIKNGIIKIDKQQASTYTIMAIPDEDTGTFYNLVLKTDGDGEIQTGDLFEYKPSEEWLADPSQAFKGGVRISKSNIQGLESILNSGSLSAKCEPYLDAGWVCSFGHNHAPGTCNASSYTFEVWSSYDCSGGGGNTSTNDNHSYIEIDESLDGGSGGTVGSGGGTSPGGGGVGDDNPPGFDDDGTFTTPSTGGIYPFPHCGSFDYYSPTGSDIAAAAVIALEAQFVVELPNGAREIDVLYPGKTYFIVPSWMRYGYAATETAKVVYLAMQATQAEFIGNPNMSKEALGELLSTNINLGMRALGGRFSPTAPFPINNAEPYQTSLFSTGNCN